MVEEANNIIIDDRVVIELDNAMAVRRGESAVGNNGFVYGILEKRRRSIIGKLISQIESTTEDPDFINFTIALLALKDEIFESIDKLMRLSYDNREPCNFQIPDSTIPCFDSCEVTIYVGSYSSAEIKNFINDKKQSTDTHTWVYICIDKPYNEWKSIAFADRNNKFKYMLFD
jgi:hypothetical protein